LGLKVKGRFKKKKRKLGGAEPGSGGGRGRVLGMIAEGDWLLRIKGKGKEKKTQGGRLGDCKKVRGSFGVGKKEGVGKDQKKKQEAHTLNGREGGGNRFWLK